jgi:hypothetical protein
VLYTIKEIVNTKKKYGDEKMSISNETAKIIAESIGVKQEKFRHKTHFQRASVWESHGKRRLYIPKNAYEQAGYIDLETESIFPTRPGNWDILKEVLDRCKYENNKNEN